MWGYLISYQSITVKPSLDSSSGKGIHFFGKEENGKFYEKSSKGELTKELLERLYPEKNFIIQETFKQSSFISQFNPTSVNTLRIQTYRSVKDNQIYIPNMIMRIGSKGALVDNAHAGGVFIGIDKDGTLQKTVCNQYGEQSKVFNGIDFSQNEFCLPNYEEIIAFAKNVAGKIHHARLLALDVVLDENNHPKLLEYNLGAFGLWLFQFTTGTAFGEWTEEIIEYAKSHKQESSRVFIDF